MTHPLRLAENGAGRREWGSILTSGSFTAELPKEGEGPQSPTSASLETPAAPRGMLEWRARGFLSLKQSPVVTQDRKLF